MCEGHDHGQFQPDETQTVIANRTFKSGRYGREAGSETLLLPGCRMLGARRNEAASALSLNVTY